MNFEIGKCYRNKDGYEIRVLEEVDTFHHGPTLVCETNYHERLVGLPLKNVDKVSVDWEEISNEQFRLNFINKKAG